MEPRGENESPHSPAPTLWPVGFAVGIACILAGLVVSWPAVAAGAVITAIFGYLWARDVMGGYRSHALPEGGPAPAGTEAAEPVPAHRGRDAMPASAPGEPQRYSRSRFLEAATLGLGSVIGGIVTAPVLGFMVIPAFTGQEKDEIDLGPLANFPEGDFVETTFLMDPSAGEVSRRTAYIRYNGLRGDEPSFTIVSNRCVHLGCPVQASGLRIDERQKKETTKSGELTLTPVQPAGFSCPCHGGAYDTEGNRVQGPPVRALDRYTFSVKNGRLILGETYSVSKVELEQEDDPKTARIYRYGLSGPGEHVDGLESWLYPIQPDDLDF